jgi:uncharacterized repeat protein (TIGR01451 family)
MLRRHKGTIWPLALAGVVLAFGASALDAQTPENTVITNTAIVTFTDANDNTYAPDSASASVTVGFVAGVDVTGNATATPAPGSSGNSLTYSVQNLGNGTDAMVINVSLSTTGIVTVTGYVYDGTTYATLALLNGAIAADSLVQDTTITVDVEYDVASGTGGQPVDMTFTATSGRDGTKSDAVTTTITPSESIALAVTPDSNQTADRLPSNGTQYTGTFTVTNNGDGPETFDLVGSTSPSGAITVVSVNGGTSSIALAAGASQDVDVVYTIGDVAAGVVDTLILTATAQTAPNPTDRGHLTFRVVRPLVSIAKAVFMNDSVTALVSPPDSVVPNDSIWYKITVTNSGTASADSVHIDDNLPAELTYLSANGDAAGWTISNSGNDVDAYLLGLAPGASRYIWIRARVN